MEVKVNYDKKNGSIYIRQVKVKYSKMGLAMVRRSNDHVRQGNTAL